MCGQWKTWPSRPGDASCGLRACLSPATTAASMCSRRLLGRPVISKTVSDIRHCSEPGNGDFYPKLCVTGADVCNARNSCEPRRSSKTELMDISAIADDTIKFERIVVRCAAHPDEVPFALHQFMRRGAKYS